MHHFVMEAIIKSEALRNQEEGNSKLALTRYSYGEYQI